MRIRASAVRCAFELPPVLWQRRYIATADSMFPPVASELACAHAASPVGPVGFGGVGRGTGRGAGCVAVGTGRVGSGRCGNVMGGNVGGLDAVALGCGGRPSVGTGGAGALAVGFGGVGVLLRGGGSVFLTGGGGSGLDVSAGSVVGTESTSGAIRVAPLLAVDIVPPAPSAGGFGGVLESRSATRPAANAPAPTNTLAATSQPRRERRRTGERGATGAASAEAVWNAGVAGPSGWVPADTPTGIAGIGDVCGASSSPGSVATVPDMSAVLPLDSS